MKIDIDRFTGMRTAIEPDLLEPNEAQRSVNTLIETGAVESFLGDSALKALAKTGVQTIWRYPATAETQHWLEFTSPAHVVRSPILQDVWDRIYWTDSTGMRYGPAANVLSGANLPGTSYKVGIPIPTNVATLSGFSAGTAPNIETRVYFESFLSEYDEEGPLGPPSLTYTMATGSTPTVNNLTPAPTGDFNINRRRVYRVSYTGTDAVAPQLVGTYPIATTSFVDSIAQANLGKTPDSEGYEAPPDGVQNLCMTDAGIAVVSKGRDVYFAENWLPHAFNPENTQTLQHDVVALAAFEQAVIAMTKGRLYAGAGTTPGGIQLSSIRDSQACVSRRGVVVTASGAMYPSPRGLIAIGTNFQPMEVTKAIITPRQWEALNPSSFIATVQDGAYVAFFQRADTSRGVIRIDPTGKTAPYVQMLQTTGQDVIAAFYDEATQQPYIASAGQIRRFAKGGSARTWIWRSKEFDAGRPISMGAGIIDGDAGSLALRIYADGALFQAKTVTVGEPFGLKAGYRRAAWSFEVEGAIKMTRMRFAPSRRELFK